MPASGSSRNNGCEATITAPSRARPRALSSLADVDAHRRPARREAVSWPGSTWSTTCAAAHRDQGARGTPACRHETGAHCSPAVRPRFIPPPLTPGSFDPSVHRGRAPSGRQGELMDISVMIVLVIITALAFDYTNGFHDTANAVATSIATGALKPRTAVLIAGILNLVGAFLSVEVAKTISSGLV